MQNKHLSARIASMLQGGQHKQSIYAELRGSAGNDRQLAYLLAASASPARQTLLANKNRALIVVMVAQAMLALLVGYDSGQLLGGSAGLWLALFYALVPIAFAAGFSRHLAAAFNVYLLYSLVRLPALLQLALAGGLLDWWLLSLAALTLLLSWHVRRGLFPDFTITLQPRKDETGNFTFSD
ncbi:hypothetical protein [Vogesella sp. LIG4]|uniref:hypothetical protein n=1 Tax=Vogesella sp. LIG4 TaxID=1192162 RepID=UPI00081F9245|nr:hypothetical protein [Vogesella sp. LIG4]SCK25257.1 hypothetical protein PSELUDRAFT_2997 [Vogesella sp. LIG4]